MLLNATKLAAATGFSRAFIGAIKRAAYGTEDDPFKRGRYATKRGIEAWVVAHPEFRAYLAWRKTPIVPHPLHDMRSRAGKNGAKIRRVSRNEQDFIG